MAEWQNIFKGVYDNHKLEVDVLDNYLLSKLYSDDEKQVVLNVSAVFVSEGDLENFIENLPKKASLYINHSSNYTDKFLYLKQANEVIKNKVNDIDNMITEQVKNLDKSKKLILDVAESYDLDLKELHKSRKEIKSRFFVDAKNVFRTIDKTSYDIEEIKDLDIDISTNINLGKHKSSGEYFSEQLESFKKTLIIGKKKDTKQSLFVLAEEFALSSVPTVIFDLESEFEGIKESNPKPKEITEFNSSFEATGFPTEKYFYDGTEKSNLWVDLSEVSLNAFCELNAIDKKSKIVFEEAFESNPKTIEDLIEAIGKVSPSSDVKEYDIYLAKRMAKIIKLANPNLYKGELKLDSMKKTLASKIGKVSLVNIQGNKVEKYLIANQIIKDLSKEKKIFLMLPEADFFCPKSGNIIQKEINNSLLSFAAYFAVSTESLADINDSLYRSKTAKIDIIKEEDLAVKIGGSSPNRVLLRPNLSKKD